MKTLTLPSPRPGLRLLAMSRDGLLVGLAEGLVTDDLVDLRHPVVASCVRTRHPDLIGLQAEACVESADQPRPDVLAPPGCPRRRRT